MNFWPFRRRSQAALKTIDAIKPPIYSFTGQDDALRQRTEARRKASESMRARASHIDSGEAVSNILRRVK